VTNTTIDGDTDLMVICGSSSAVWTNIPNYDYLSQQILSTTGVPSFYDNITDYPLVTGSTNPSEQITGKPGLYNNVIDPTVIYGNVSSYWATAHTVEQIIIYVVGTLAATNIVVRNVEGGTFLQNKALPTIVTDSGCVSIIRFTLPTPAVCRWIRIVSTSSLNLLAIRVKILNNATATASIPYNYDYINTAGNSTKDPAFFAQYQFADVTPDLYPGCYTGIKAYQPWCLQQKYSPGQYYYLISADYKSSVVWGGLGYANEAAALAAGWEQIYNKYDYWLNGTLTQVNDQQLPKHYWYRKLK